MFDAKLCRRGTLHVMVSEVWCNREASWLMGKVGQRTVAFHQSQHGDLTNQSRKKGDIVSNKWCYPLAMTNIAIEHDHL